MPAGTCSAIVAPLAFRRRSPCDSSGSCDSRRHSCDGTPVAVTPRCFVPVPPASMPQPAVPLPAIPRPAVGSSVRSKPARLAPGLPLPRAVAMPLPRSGNRSPRADASPDGSGGEGAREARPRGNGSDNEAPRSGSNGTAAAAGSGSGGGGGGGGGGGSNEWAGSVWSAQEIADVAGGAVVRDGPPGRVCTDTRQLMAGDWFLALRGPRFDGSEFLDEAARRGCGGAVVMAEGWGEGADGGVREGLRNAGETRGEEELRGLDLPPNLPPNGWQGGLVVVPDTLGALQGLARETRRRFGGVVVGITGSVGKTTARALTALALSPLGPVHQTQGNLNNHIGVPITLLALPQTSAACVVEMGMSARGEIALLSSIATPTIGVLLNVGPAHIGDPTLGSLEAIAEAKGEMLVDAGEGDVCVVNADDARVMALPFGKGAKRVTFGRSPSCDVQLLSAHTVDGGMAVEAVIRSNMPHPQTQPPPPAAAAATTAATAAALPAAAVLGNDESSSSNTVSVRINSPGLHLADNALAAAAVAVAAGVPLPMAARHMARYEPVGMRMRVERIRRRGLGEERGEGSGERVEGKQNKGKGVEVEGDCVTLLNDAYNANPMSMASALQLLNQLSLNKSAPSSSSFASPSSPLVSGRPVAVLGDMLELGNQSESAHVEALTLCLSLTGISLLLTAGPGFKSAVAAMGGGRRDKDDGKDGGYVRRDGNSNEGDSCAGDINLGHVHGFLRNGAGRRLEVYAFDSAERLAEAIAPFASVDSQGDTTAGRGRAGSGDLCQETILGAVNVGLVKWGDVVLVKGSRGMHMELVCSAIHSAFGVEDS